MTVYVPIGGGGGSIAPIVPNAAAYNFSITPTGAVTGDPITMGSVGGVSGIYFGPGGNGSSLTDANNSNLIQLHTPNGANLNVGNNAGVNITGPLALGGATLTTPSPPAGAAGALPATPAGYWAVFLNGSSQRIPYY